MNSSRFDTFTSR